MAINTVTKALRKLYKSVTGEETNKNSPTKIISDLADNWSGGGGGVLMVHITAQPDFSTNPPTATYTSDKTYEEVYNAYNDGKVVVVESDSLSGVIFTKRSNEDAFYSTFNTFVQKIGVNAIIVQRCFVLTANSSVILEENSIKVATVS